ncbi:hypothetical protein JNUCC64_05555 [Streptomyces sp. JNUCC 64]
MRHLLEFLGVFALFQGGMGIATGLGWLDIGLLRRVGFLEGYQLFAGIALLVLAMALFGVADSMKKQGR